MPMPYLPSAKMLALRKAQRSEDVWDLVYLGSMVILAIGIVAIVLVTLEAGLR